MSPAYISLSGETTPTKCFPKNFNMPRSILDLTTEEAWRIAAEEVGEEVPPLEAVQNEDWGRDYILQLLMSLPPEILHKHDLCLPDQPNSQSQT